MPVLYPALKLVDMERPNDPISFLAYYLLKHKNEIKLPEKPEVEEKEIEQEG